MNDYIADCFAELENVLNSQVQIHNFLKLPVSSTVSLVLGDYCKSLTGAMRLFAVERGPNFSFP